MSDHGGTARHAQAAHERRSDLRLDTVPMSQLAISQPAAITLEHDRGEVVPRHSPRHAHAMQFLRDVCPEHGLVIGVDRDA